MDAILNRYEIDIHRMQLSAEHDWIALVEEHLSQIVASEKPPYKRLLEYRLKRIQSELDKSLGRPARNEGDAVSQADP